MTSATASDRLTSYTMRFTSLSLTSQSGQVVPLMPAEQSIEFLHSGGTIEPVLTVTVPQDVYKSMNAVISYAQFVHLTQDSSGTNIHTDATLQPDATFRLAAPLTVGGTAMAIRMDLQGASSGNYTSSSGQDTYTITPSLNVTSIVYTAVPGNASNGSVVEVAGRVSSLSSTGFLLTLAPDGDEIALNTPQAGVQVPVLVDGATSFEGIQSFGNIADSNFVDADLAFLPDGTVHATRIQVDDTASTNLSIGPTFFTSTLYKDLDVFALQQQGDTLSIFPTSYIPYAFAAEPTFRVSSRFTNLASLPFTPVFDQNTFSIGQRIAVFSGPVTTNQGRPTFPSTLTLEPQTINGDVAAVNEQGDTTVYTITLDPSDLISIFGGPSTIEVYAASATILNLPAPPATGSRLRARGLLFNDQGTYRLDSEWIAEGVTP